MIFGGKVYGVLGDANWQILMYTAIIPPIVGAILAIFFVPDDLEYTKELVKKGKETGEKISYISMYKENTYGLDWERFFYQVQISQHIQHFQIMQLHT